MAGANIQLLSENNYFKKPSKDPFLFSDKMMQSLLGPSTITGLD